MRKTHKLVCVAVACAATVACANSRPDVTGGGTQLATRQIQTREYNTLDHSMTLRSVIATLQDLGFVIDATDAGLGTVTATRQHKYDMRMTVTVRDRESRRVVVRANARIGEDTVTNPITYQDFFVALDKAMYLTQEKVD